MERLTRENHESLERVNMKENVWGYIEPHAYCTPPHAKQSSPVTYRVAPLGGH